MAFKSAKGQCYEIMSGKAAKELSGQTLRVIEGDEGGFATCEASNGRYYTSVPLFNGRKIPEYEHVKSCKYYQGFASDPIIEDWNQRNPSQPIARAVPGSGGETGIGF